MKMLAVGILALSFAAFAASASAAPQCPTGTHWYEAGKACVANGGHPSPRSDARTACPAGTHWYEAGKACVANGGHPSPRS
ncbi:MAG: hypothetical protein Q8N10_04605 [Phenylobacterium sp.]|uniref:hypothetical protein n=1 Tax=Phenylobacterium sp. TaxID=1871053 RepID=UPI002720C25E|nr:hypothetical protein [Phenylobacterium sp.]MDO8913996.1 hypothetical protein [Phenylobacterium sp.]MDP3099764.1 hypothetical protein [Phenylobacterium sp.]